MILNIQMKNYTIFFDNRAENLVLKCLHTENIFHYFAEVIFSMKI